MGKYKGMTVNERLYISGLINKFDKAVKNKDTQGIISILKEVELTDESITDILHGLKLSIKPIIFSQSLQKETKGLT